MLTSRSEPGVKAAKRRVCEGSLDAQGERRLSVCAPHLLVAVSTLAANARPRGRGRWCSSSRSVVPAYAAIDRSRCLIRLGSDASVNADGNSNASVNVSWTGVTIDAAMIRPIGWDQAARQLAEFGSSLGDLAAI